MGKHGLVKTHAKTYLTLEKKKKTASASLYNVNQMSALSALNGGCPSPPSPPAGHLLRFFKRAADRSRGDIPYKERNSENLQIAQCERKREEKKLL